MNTDSFVNQLISEDAMSINGEPGNRLINLGAFSARFKRSSRITPAGSGIGAVDKAKAVITRMAVVKMEKGYVPLHRRMVQTGVVVPGQGYTIAMVLNIMDEGTEDEPGQWAGFVPVPRGPYVPVPRYIEMWSPK